MSEPERCLDFPAFLTGVVRYEPYSNPAYSFYLSDSAIDSSISLKVDLNGLAEKPVLHKGDTVSMLACTRYDLSTMRYVLEPVDLEIVRSYGTWCISLDELAENIIEYERAQINLTAYLYRTDSDYVLGNRAVLENCSVMLKVLPENINQSIMNLYPFYTTNTVGIPASLQGTANARPGSFEYLFTLKAEPDSYFNGSPVLD